MKKILGLTVMFMSVFAISTALADTEEAGGGPGGKCISPWDNICYRIIINGQTTEKKGTLDITTK